MEKLLPGVYHVTVGNPEPLTYESFREFPALAWGHDHEIPFVKEDIEWHVTSHGIMVSMPLNSHVYGFGLQLKGFDHTNKKIIIRNNADAPSASGESHAPIPFYVTTEGYGVFVDCPRNVSFYCGEARAKGETARKMVIDIPCSGANIYLFAGKDMLDAVQKYNMFSGGGCNVPDWGLGVWYRLEGKSGAEDWINFAKKFREEELAVSVLGLEPGWQTHAYSCTYVFKDETASREAISRIKDMGYRVNLWEHCYTHPDSPIYSALLPYSGDYEVWGGIVPDFALPEARKIFIDHHKTLGVDSYKLDECDGSDHTGGWSYPDGAAFLSGLDGEQMHHLLGMLYQQTINTGYDGAYHSVRAQAALAAPYPFVLYSDLYEHDDFIRGVVNAGFSGLLWSPEVRHAKSVADLIRRIQTVIFSPQALINAWYLKNPPWENIDINENNMGNKMENHAEVFDIVKELFDVRKAFIPYLSEMFKQYHETGKPVFRALVLDYPGDEETYHVDDEYLMGNDYLFAPLTEKSDTRKVYLPCDGWVWSNTVYQKGWHTLTCPLNKYLLFKLRQ